MKHETTETGPLAELNVQPGDVVEYFGGNRYTVLEDMCLESHVSGKRIKYSTYWHTACSFRMISRASRAPKTCGEMTDAEKLDQEWKVCSYKTRQCLDLSVYEAKEVFGADLFIYRIKPQPVVGEVVLRGWMNSETDSYFDCEDSNDDAKTTSLTMPTIDGELITGEFTSPDGHVVKVEEV